jgi:hypothetical protein
MKCACPNFDVIGLLQDAPTPRPEVFQSQDEFLESHHGFLSNLIVQEPRSFSSF